MAFGSIYYKGAPTAWSQGQLYVKDATSWKPVVHLYEKTAPTVWTERFNADLTPPAAPPLFVNTYDAAARTMTTTFTASADADVTGMCCKISATGYPTQPGVYTSADSPTTVQADGTQFWSWTTTPGGKSTRKHVGFANSKKYYMSAWSRDASGNWSAPVSYTWTFAAAPAPVKTLTTKTAYVYTTDSGAWRSAYGWRSGYDLYQGGTYNDQGFWFYGTAISTLLKNAYDITSVQIYVQRSSSSHGISGAGNIMIGHHALTSQPSGSPGTNAVQGEYNAVDLGRGAGAWVTLNNTWDTEFKAGTFRGLGIMYTTTSVTSSYYNIVYGKGTSSGRLKFTWREYV